jgi:hypothetical protein
MTLCNMVVEAGGKTVRGTLNPEDLTARIRWALGRAGVSLPGARPTAGLDMRCCMPSRPAVLSAAAGAQCRVRHC